MKFISCLAIILLAAVSQGSVLQFFNNVTNLSLDDEINKFVVNVDNTIVIASLANGKHRFLNLDIDTGAITANQTYQKSEKLKIIGYLVIRKLCLGYHHNFQELWRIRELHLSTCLISIPQSL